MIPQKDYEYTTLMNMLHVSVSKHLLDEHFTLVWANGFYYELIDYPREEYEALYQNRPDLYYKNDPEEWDKLCATVVQTISEGKTTYNRLSRIRRKNGEYAWVRMAGTFADEYIDGFQVSYTVMTDISDIIQMQKEQSVTYDNLPGFVGKYRVGRDLRLTLLDANDQYVEFFGEGCWKNAEDPLFRRNLEENAGVIESQRDKLLAGEPVHFTTRMRDQKGNDAWLQINASCIDWQGGDPVYLAIYIDITNETELRRMQKRLEEQAAELKTALECAKKANRAKSDFLSHMSHDIRTPMNAIMGMTEIARAHPDDRLKVQDCLKKISLSSQHLLGLINDVLDMSRIESGKMTLNNDSLSLPELLENIVAIMQPQVKAKEQVFSIHLQRVRHERYCSDALRLRQILINILSNASKFTPCGESIAVHVEELDSGKPELAVLRMTISDTGIGMQPAFLARLFDPFSREQDSRVDKTEGSGLGMAITKKLVDLLGGSLEVQSRVGEGTVFTVTLPLQIEEAPPLVRRFPDLRILVVDDDAILCEYMLQTMQSLGVCVDSADTGETAVARVAQAHQCGRPYDAVFLDWKMPYMDGPHTARAIRDKIGKELPILIVSAYDWSDIEGEAQAAGVNGFISKPIFVSTLCRALSRYALSAAPAARGQEQASSDEFAGRRFLLVEDNELNREIAEELLSAAGAEIEWAADGAAGAEKFIQSPEGYFDLILMDVQMPILNGYKATEKIRRLPRADAETVPILAMTADAFAEDIARAKEAGMDGHLAKPLELASMKREIHKVLR